LIFKLLKLIKKNP